MKVPVSYFLFCERRLTAVPEQTPHMFCIVKEKEGIQYQLAEEESFIKAKFQNHQQYRDTPTITSLSDRFIGYPDIFKVNKIPALRDLNTLLSLFPPYFPLHHWYMEHEVGECRKGKHEKKGEERIVPERGGG